MSEMTGWLVQSGIIAAALASGAWLWERGARWSGRAARGAWLIALSGSVLLPFALRLLPQPTWSDVVPPVGIVRIDPLAVSSAAPVAAPIDFARIALSAWIVLSLGLLVYAAALMLRLARARRKWRPAHIDGAEVLVSRNVGPAAVGVRRATVVIPAWALELDAELRRLMLLHEQEHVRAGDPRLLIVGLALVAVMPWHPLVWFQLIRLRNAIELDCDARVLRHGVDPRRYGSLLLEVGRRRGGSPLVLATFAEPRLFLEERIRRIARWPVQKRPLRAAVLSVIALAVFATSLLARVRVESVTSAVAGQSTVLEALGLPGVTMEMPDVVPLMVSDTPPTPVQRPNPRQTPYTKAPVLTNTDDVMRDMTANYPRLLRDAGVSGTTVLWVLVSEQGNARYPQLSKSSGYKALDEAALKVAASMRFSPALNGDRVAPAWIEVPVAFGPLAHSVSVSAQPTAAPVTREAPTFTPMTVRPELTNREDVRRAMIELYPPLLRDADIGGTAVLWFMIDETGRVVRTQVKTTSGYEALDQAAMRVGTVMRFSPARNRDQQVPVWIELPIQFAPPNQQGGGESTMSVSMRSANSDVVLLNTITTRQDTALRALRQGAAEQLYGARISDTTRERRLTESMNELQRRARELEGQGAEERRVLQRNPQDPDISKAPVFTPMTVRPELLNRDEVARALVRLYPPELRDQSIGGTTLLWVFINDKGNVENALVKTAGTQPALDTAAIAVAKTMRFSPAQNRDRSVPVWIEIPIQFAAK